MRRSVKFVLGELGEKGNELWSETDLYNIAEVMATLRTSVSLSVKGDNINPIRFFFEHDMS